MVGLLLPVKPEATFMFRLAGLCARGNGLPTKLVPFLSGQASGQVRNCPMPDALIEANLGRANKPSHGPITRLSYVTVSDATPTWCQCACPP